MRFRRVSVLGVLSGLVAGVVGITAAPVGARTAQKPSGEPVVIMVLGSFSGQGLDFTDIPDAAKAAAAALNKQDGINGRPVKVVACDSGIDPNKDAECARQAVDEEMVAVVGAFTTSEQYMPVLEEAGIPSVADYGISFSELTSDLSFPIGATALGGTAGMGAILADNGAKKIDIAYLDLPGGAGKLAADFANYGVDPRGGSTTSTPVPINGADLTPSIQQTIDTDSNGVLLALTDPEYSKWVQGYRQTGGEAKIAAAGSTVNPTNIKNLGETGDGIYVSANFKPASLAKTDPGVRQMVKEVRAYDKDIELVDASIEAWAGVHLVADALDGQATMDAATLIAQLNQDKEWDTRVGPSVNFAVQPPEVAAAGGLLQGINRVFTTDVYYARVKNGKLVALDGKEHNFLVP